MSATYTRIQDAGQVHAADQSPGQLEPRAPSFRCQFCERVFKRLEHAQRHERTHTKEAPYKCPCGKAFPRRDLLRRHEKSAHDFVAPKRRRGPQARQPSTRRPLAALNGPTSEVQCAQAASTNGARYPGIESFDFIRPRPTLPSILSPLTPQHRQTSFDASPSKTPVWPPHPDRPSVQDDQRETIRVEPTQQLIPDSFNFSEFTPPNLDPFDLFGDADTFIDNIDLSSYFAPQDLGLNTIHYPVSNNANESTVLSAEPLAHKDGNGLDTRSEPPSFSRFGSPLPSMQQDDTGRDRHVVGTAVARPTSCWKVSPAQYTEIEIKLRRLSHVLPRDFVLPSRHTLSRFLEGCIKGLNEHLPYVHLPTFSVTTAAPDLLLAMASIGAEFRFEAHLGIGLFYAAKAMVMHQLQQQSDGSAIGVLAQLPVSSEPALLDRDNQLQTMQAILGLMVQGSWGPKTLVGEAIAFQSMLAVLVRENDCARYNDCIGDQTEDLETAWRGWIRIEGRRRTRIMAYAFINLQSVAYNVPPAILTSEIVCGIPESAKEWKAETAQAWAEARRSSSIRTGPFSEAYRSLFLGPDAQDTKPSSAIGNYALIFAVLQCIYFRRQDQLTMSLKRGNSDLRTGDIESVSRALQNWQARWEQSPESNLEPQSPAGPIAFNSTALLRLAWIRLHFDLGPCRSLASRNPVLIVEAFKSCPPLQRAPALIPALLHAAHALSVPVRLGVKYVAKTQTLSWSVQHSLSNLECAIFLSKWFEAIASTVATTPLTFQERGLISMIRSLVRETGFFSADAFGPAHDSTEWRKLIQQLGTAVAVLWAEIFSGVHVFELVSTIGVSLDLFAKLLQGTHGAAIEYRAA